MGREELQTQRINKSFVRCCCKGRALRRTGSRKPLALFEYERNNDMFPPLFRKIFQHREKLIDILITTNIYEAHFYAPGTMFNVAHELFSLQRSLLSIILEEVLLLTPVYRQQSLSAEE